MDKVLEGSKTPTLAVWIANAHENVFINIHGMLSFCKRLCEQCLSESTYYT